MIDDKIFEAALADPTNRRVMYAIAYHLGRDLDPEEREQAICLGLMKCLNRHLMDRGQKFTTSLHYYVTKQMGIARVRSRTERSGHRPLDDARHVTASRHERQDDLDHINECMGKIGDGDRRLIRQYYLEGLTYGEVAQLNQVSESWAWQKVGRAVDRLRQVCIKGE